MQHITGISFGKILALRLPKTVPEACGKVIPTPEMPRLRWLALKCPKLICVATISWTFPRYRFMSQYVHTCVLLAGGFFAVDKIPYNVGDRR
jgi:prepilin signal peptidase PulO-like enzyme (type II secretory pathway)